MKPAAFAYHRPGSVAQALGLLAELDDAKILAGGQSLMAMMNYRYIAPENLIDINQIAALAGMTKPNLLYYFRRKNNIIVFQQFGLLIVKVLFTGKSPASNLSLSGTGGLLYFISKMSIQPLGKLQRIRTARCF